MQGTWFGLNIKILRLKFFYGHMATFLCYSFVRQTEMVNSALLNIQKWTKQKGSTKNLVVIGELFFVHCTSNFSSYIIGELFFVSCVCVCVFTPPLPWDGGTVWTVIQVHAVNLIDIRLGEDGSPFRTSFLCFFVFFLLQGLRHWAPVAFR